MVYTYIIIHTKKENWEIYYKTYIFLTGRHSYHLVKRRKNWEEKHFFWISFSGFRPIFQKFFRNTLYISTLAILSILHTQKTFIYFFKGSALSCIAFFKNTTAFFGLFLSILRISRVSYWIEKKKKCFSGSKRSFWRS